MTSAWTQNPKCVKIRIPDQLTMANRNTRRRRRNRGGGQGTLPGPSKFITPTERDDSFYVQVTKPVGVPSQVTPTHFSVTLKGSAGQQLLHGSRCANTWTTGKVPVESWKDILVQCSSDDSVASTCMIWFASI
jgi:hypothetical protein